MQLQVLKEHLTASKADQRDEMLAEGAFAAICRGEDTKATLQKLEVEATRTREKEAKAAVALNMEEKAARDEEEKFEFTTRQNAEKVSAAEQQHLKEEMEAGVDAQQDALIQWKLQLKHSLLWSAN